ncbi:MAG: hypothetical protein FWH14_05755 [Oscillospiraceae bacterium]|nr:hypothetical protein [Oscillospiraceae bacterium]
MTCTQIDKFISDKNSPNYAIDSIMSIAEETLKPFLLKERQKIVDKTKSDIERKRQKQNYKMSPDEKTILKWEKTENFASRFDGIDMIPSEDQKLGTGYIYVGHYGVDIYYSSDDSELTIHIVKAHEAGHIFFHLDSLGRITPLQETEANYYAEKVSQKLAQSQSKLTPPGDFRYTDNDIHKAITDAYPNYDELIKKLL